MVLENFFNKGKCSSRRASCAERLEMCVAAKLRSESFKNVEKTCLSRILKPKWVFEMISKLFHVKELTKIHILKFYKKIPQIDCVIPIKQKFWNGQIQQKCDYSARNCRRKLFQKRKMFVSTSCMQWKARIVRSSKNADRN